MVTGNKFLRAVLLVMFVLSTSVWGEIPWNPDADPNLVFNMDFEIHDLTTATDSHGHSVGDVNNCKDDVNGPWITDPNLTLFGYGTSCSFASALDIGGGDANSCQIIMDINNDVWNMGSDGNSVRTLAVWFSHEDGAGTFVGMEYSNDTWWQFRLRNTKINVDAKYGGIDVLRMYTAKALNDLGIVADTWHHAVAVIDRRTYYGSKVYVDGAPVAVDILGHDYYEMGFPNRNAIIGGAGGQLDDYDGTLDELRVYTRGLDANEISFLYQYNPNKPVKVYALKPLPNYVNISTKTGFAWVPLSGATNQTLILGTDPNLDDPCNVVKTLNCTGSDSDATNAEVNGPLDFGRDYYWCVDTNDSAIEGPVWTFQTDFGYAINPSPEDGAPAVPIGPVDLRWTGSPDAITYDVYISDDYNEVNTLNIPPLADNYPDSNVVAFEGSDPVKGVLYYWRVVTSFDDVNIPGTIWSFRAASYGIIVNTSDANVVYDSVTYLPLTMTFQDTNTVITGTKGTDDVAIFDFNSTNWPDGNGLQISSQYEITVIPLFTSTVESDMNALGVRETSRPMAIHVDGDFIFDGRLDISGEVFTSLPDDAYSPYARCGGYRGPRAAGSEPAIATPHSVEVGYFVAYGPDTNDRFIGGTENITKNIASPTATGFGHFGPGAGGVNVYGVGDGGGYAGAGGEGGRGWLYGAFLAGEPYGDKKVPVPVGGSAGGSGKKPCSGGSGGGGVEIYTTGSVILGPNARILAKGGTPYKGGQAGGGGAGGSVRIIADVNFVNEGIISVNGGAGGESTNKANDTGGGGSAGRIAIWYGVDYNDYGTITAAGGADGAYQGDAGGGASAGQDGTIFMSKGDPRKASAPTPRDGNKQVYAGSIPLKWHSGFNATTDVVSIGVTPDPNTFVQVGSSVSATRGQHTSTLNTTVVNGGTYYWQVVTDGSVESDVWSFEVVNWKCEISNFDSRPQWDSGPFCDCVEDLTDLAYFSQFWMKPGYSNMSMGANSGLAKFLEEWLMVGGRN